MDAILGFCNRSTVEESLAAINSLTTAARADLLAEFHKRPDIRFGDNLLVALSTIQ